MLRVVMFLSDEHALWLAFLAGLICFGVSLAALYLLHHARAAAQHRRAVALLQANNQRLRGMLDNLPQGVVLYDAQARIVTCNERYIEM
jgi:PAS domain-containing protein